MKDLLQSQSFFKKTKMALWLFGEHAFSVILIFVLFDILLGALIVYIYIIMPQGSNLLSDAESFRFNESVYQKVLIQQEKNRQYLNILPQSDSEAPLEASR